MRFVIDKRGVFVEGQYARSRADGSCIYKVLSAGEVVKYTEEDYKTGYPYSRHRFLDNIKFQKDVTLRKYGEVNGGHFLYSKTKRVTLLTEHNFHSYYPSKIWVPQTFYILIHVSNGRCKDTFLADIKNLDFRKLIFPTRLIDIEYRRVYFNGAWHELGIRNETIQES
jgi:hypothetical protein